LATPIRCGCDAARKARRYSAHCNGTAAAAAAAHGAAITQCTDLSFVRSLFQACNAATGKDLLPE